MNYKIVTNSGREIVPTRVETFNVVQDNRTKTIHVAHYDHAQLGPRTMSFINCLEALVNPRGRYVPTHANKDQCARLVIEQEEVVS
jgi:hypothetical protein